MSARRRVEAGGLVTSPSIPAPVGVGMPARRPAAAGAALFAAFAAALATSAVPAAASQTVDKIPLGEHQSSLVLLVKPH